MSKEFSYNKLWLAPFGIDGIKVVHELQKGPDNMFSNSMAAAYITGHIAKIVYHKL